MLYIKGYIFENEHEAFNAREKCDLIFGIPISPDDVTQNWCEYQFAALNNPSFCYIPFNQSLLPILGEPQDIEIIEPPMQ